VHPAVEAHAADRRVHVGGIASQDRAPSAESRGDTLAGGEGTCAADFVGGAHPENVDIPASVINGDGDQIVPIADSAILSSKLIRKNRH
jgi:hypothetical protein